MVANGSCDFTPPVSLTLERSAAMDFTIPLMREEITLISSVAEVKQKLQVWVYVNIFPVIVWVVTAMVALCSALGLFFTSGHFREDSEKFTFLNSLAATLLFFIQMDYPLEKR